MRAGVIAALAGALLACAPALSAQPGRIVSTAPSITEMLFALGLSERVAGVTDYCHYPPEARGKPKVGSFLEPDIERILALKPDLVLVIKNPIELTANLRRHGLRAEELDQDSISGILNSLAVIGRLTGRQEQARALIGKLNAQLAVVRNAVAGQRKRTAIFLVGRSPGTLQGMVGAGPNTFIDELMTIAGCDNILKRSPIQYPKVSIEQVLTADPEVILDMGDFAHAEGRPMEPESRLLSLWGAYPRLRAVRERRVKQVASDIFIRPGPRMGTAAEELARLLREGGAK